MEATESSVGTPAIYELMMIFNWTSEAWKSKYTWVTLLLTARTLSHSNTSSFAVCYTGSTIKRANEILISHPQLSLSTPTLSTRCCNKDKSLLSQLFRQNCTNPQLDELPTCQLIILCWSRTHLVLWIFPTGCVQVHRDVSVVASSFIPHALKTYCIDFM